MERIIIMDNLQQKYEDIINSIQMLQYKLGQRYRYTKRYKRYIKIIKKTIHEYLDQLQHMTYDKQQMFTQLMFVRSNIDIDFDNKDTNKMNKLFNRIDNMIYN